MYEVPAMERKGFTNELWRSIVTIYNEILAHPFLRGLTDGTLTEERFRFYVLQDALYLREYARALSLTGVRSPDESTLVMFNEHSAGAIMVDRRRRIEQLLRRQPSRIPVTY
jgi:thiaminase (transcriptional activator TenA)